MTRWLGRLVAATLLGMLALSGPADAAPAQSGVTMSLAAGFDGWIAPNRSFPLVVTITADHLIEGEVQIRFPTTYSSILLRRAVEIEGGNTETIRFVGPPGQETGILKLEAVLRVDGEKAADADTFMKIDPDVEVVGMLPGTAARNRGVVGTMAVEATGRPELVEVPPEQLVLGPLALDPLDQLATQATELAQAPEEWRAAITGWVQRGGQLLVEMDDPAALAAVLPAEWIPRGPVEAATAGLGRVRAVGPDWATALLPTPTRSVHEEDTIASDLSYSHDVAVPLADQARPHLPAAKGLAWLLLLYVVVAGPVVFFGARRLRRAQAAWVVVPVLALLSTGVAVGAASRLRDPVGSAQVTVYEVGPGGSVATSWALMTNPHNGSVGFTTPAGWNVGPVPDDTGLLSFEGRTREPQAQVDAAGRVTATVDPPTGGGGMMVARGAAEGMEDALVVEARSEADGQVVGTVRNNLDVPLDHVVALVGPTGLADVGTLGPGEERSFTIDDTTDFAWGAGLPEMALWPGVLDEVFVDAMRNGVPVPPIRPGEGVSPLAADDVVRQAWSETLMQTGWNYRPPGQVLAVGWTDELPSPLERSDGTAEWGDINAAVVARGTVVPAGDRLTDAAVVRSFTRGPLAEQLRIPEPDPDAGQADPADDPDEERAAEGKVIVNGNARIVVAAPDRAPGVGLGLDGQDRVGLLYQFDLPGAVGDRPVDTSRLVLRVPSWYEAAELWVPGGWQRLAIPRGAAAETAIPIPAEAVVGGTVFVRAALPSFPPESAPGFVLYEQEAQQ